MSRYFPHSAYAEDQPFAHAILGVHVLTRNLTAGTIAGAAVSGVRQMIPALRNSRAAAAAASTANTASSSATASTAAAAAARTAAATMSRVPFSQRLIVSAANGSLVGLGLGAAMLAARMYGRDDMEWRDRSWRLLEHSGQLETDDWTYAGMAAGLGAALAVRGSRPALRQAGLRGLLGSSALGSVAGTVGYVVWRHGINGGVFPAEKEAKKEAAL